MRIIAGTLKGRKLIEPIDIFTRPLKDLTKESIFNILEHSNLTPMKLKNSNVLDLFAGVGSFGIECISRGAKRVTFLENYPPTLKILNQNLIKLNCSKKTEVIEENIFNIKNIPFFSKKKFHIIFLDPPYKEKELINLLDEIISLKLLAKNGLIIIHRHKKEKEVFNEKFRILKTKTYGISKIIFGN